MRQPGFSAEVTLDDRRAHHGGQAVRPRDLNGVRPQQVAPLPLFGRPDVPEGVPIAPSDCYSLYEDCAPCILHRVPPYGATWRKGVREVRYCTDRFGGLRIIRRPCLHVPCNPFVPYP
jgi:hypothetical protein